MFGVSARASVRHDVCSVAARKCVAVAAVNGDLQIDSILPCRFPVCYVRCIRRWQLFNYKVDLLQWRR